MSNYTLNGVDLSVYGIVAGHFSGSNIALSGCFDLPARIGETQHEWDDENGVEPYVAAGDIFFSGRNIEFSGHMGGNIVEAQTKLAAFYSALDAFTDTVILSTPYGSFNVTVDSVKPEYKWGVTTVDITFREPVVDLTGTLPATGASDYLIDSIPMKSFGLYISKVSGILDLQEMKENKQTIYGQEGVQIAKRKAQTLSLEGFIMTDTLTSFKSKISALYKAFSAPGLRTIRLNAQFDVACFAVNGFSVSKTMLFTSDVIAEFRIDLVVTSVTKV